MEGRVQGWRVELLQHVAPGAFQVILPFIPPLLPPIVKGAAGVGWDERYAGVVQQRLPSSQQVVFAAFVKSATVTLAGFTSRYCYLGSADVYLVDSAHGAYLDNAVIALLDCAEVALLDCAGVNPLDSDVDAEQFRHHSAGQCLMSLGWIV